jgi:alanine dehydrogenase
MSRSPGPAKTLILTQADVRALLTMDRVVAAVEEAFVAHGRGEAQMPPKVYLWAREHEGDFRAMPAALGGVVGVKWVNAHPRNPARFGLPAVMGLFILNDPATAAPLAVMDATLLTAMRTGAAGAVASRHLAVGTPRTIGFVGAGVQARVLLQGHRVVYRDFEVRVADVDPDAAARFATEFNGTVVSAEEASSCDILCTTTPVRAAIVKREWIRGGTHINAIGADAPGKQELDPQILIDATVVVDDIHQATHSGEINVPFAKGLLGARHIYGTLGEVVSGRKGGREGDEITVFDSTGLAIQDIAVARLVHDLARQRGVGIEVDFLGT